MNNAEFIKGIEAVVEGLNVIKSALGGEVMNAPETVEAPAEVSGGQYTRKQLESMKYNEFKKLAASLGVKCTGTRDEIIERVLALDTTAEEVTEAEETAPAEEEKKPKRGRAKKTAPAEEVPAEEAEESEEEEDKKIVPVKKKLSKKEEVPARDEFDEQAEAVAEETSVEDIIAALEDAGVKATKKNYMQKLAEALREGLIELGDDEEEDEEAEESDSEEETAEEEDEEESSDDSEEITATSYFSEYDPEGINDPSAMTKKRAKAVEKKMQSILDDYSNEDVTDDDISDYINDHATSDEVDSLGEDPEPIECLKMYMELVKRTIDDDGEEHDPADPYEIDGHDMCCGHELKYSKKTNKYICEHCGSEYEAE